MRNIINRGVIQNVDLATVAKAIWEGKAINGSVLDPMIAMYSFMIVSDSQVNIQPNVRGGEGLFLPAPTASQRQNIWIHHTLNGQKPPAALLAGLCWIQLLLDTYPNRTTNSAPLPLPIPVDTNEGVAKDAHHTLTI
jgi:hypothetical protein